MAEKTISQLTGVGERSLLMCNRDGAVVNSNVCDFSSSLVVGVEVELENTHAIESPYWQNTHDASLRNNGMEYVSIPFHINKAGVVLHDLTSKLPTNAEASGRCGLHVHLNCLDMSERKFRNMLQMLYESEASLFRVSGGRHDNLFCVPWKGSEKEPFLLQYLQGRTNLSNLVGQCRKYAGINLCPLFERGTIEFRMHKGSKNPTEILAWLLRIINFKKHVLEMI